MHRTILCCVAALVFLGGLSGCGGGDKRTKYIRQMIESVNELADVLAQINDESEANHFKVRLKAVSERIAKIQEELGKLDKPENTIKSEYKAMTERLIALRKKENRELTVKDVELNLEKGKAIQKSEAQQLLEQINALYGSFEAFENDIKICCRRAEVEIVRIRLLDPAVWKVIEESCKNFKEPDFTIEEISPGVTKGEWLIKRLALSMKQALQILQGVKSEATATNGKAALLVHVQEMKIVLEQLRKMGKVLSGDAAGLQAKYGEVESLKAGILGQKGRIQAGIVPNQDERDPRMWPVLKEVFDAFDELDFDWKPPQKSSGMGGMGGMPGMGGGMPGGGMQGGAGPGMRPPKGGMQGGPPR